MERFSPRSVRRALFHGCSRKQSIDLWILATKSAVPDDEIRDMFARYTNIAIA